MTNKLTKKSKWLFLAIVYISIFSINGLAQVSIKPFCNLGVLLSELSPEDLGYVGSIDDEYLTTDGVNYGGGLQLFIAITPKQNHKFGLECSYSRLFTSTYTGAYNANTTDTETALKFLLLYESYPGNKRFFCQFASGISAVNWKTNYAYSSYYQSIDEDYGNTKMHLAFGAGAGFSFIKTDYINLPLMLRFDFIAKHGILLSSNLCLGVEFKF